jgi:hypothetical protein
VRAVSAARPPPLGDLVDGPSSPGLKMRIEMLTLADAGGSTPLARAARRSARSARAAFARGRRRA